MKILFILVVLLTPICSFAKCWGIYDLRTTICAKVLISENQNKCVKEAKLINMTIPKAHLQDLKKISSLKADSKILIKFGEAGCKKISSGNEYFLLLEGMCDDKKGAKPTYNKFLARDSLEVKTYLGHTGSHGKDIKIKCDQYGK